MMKNKDLWKYDVDDWVDEFSAIYGGVDKHRTPAEIWLLLMEDASKVAEYVRTEKYADVPKALAHVFCWTCALVWRLSKKNNLGIEINLKKEPLSKIIWHKYPKRCCLCGQERCICSARRAELENLSKEEKEKVLKSVEQALQVARERVENIPKTLDELAIMFREIYKGVHYSLPIESIAFHFMEEVGEVSSCIRVLREEHKNKSGKSIEEIHKQVCALEDEIADVFSWTVSLLMKLDYMLGAGAKFVKVHYDNENEEKSQQTVNLKLSSVLWKAFQKEDGTSIYCPTCRRRPCECTAVTF